MSANETFDLIVIGSGPGGYVGAIRAAQLGMKVAVIEKDKTFGGTCLNVGCIPSKALLESSEHFSAAQHDFASHGILVGDVKIDLAKMMERKRKVVQGSTQGISFLFKKNKIQAIQGLGSFKDAHTIQVKKDNGETVLFTTKYTVIATGSVPNSLPFLPFDKETVISSTEALELSSIPKNMAVIGAGAIGLEMGSVWMRLGTQVTVFEAGPKICGPMDKQISAELQKLLTRQGMKFVLNAKVKGAKISKKSATLEYELQNVAQSLEVEKILVAAGRKPFTAGLGLENVGIQVDARGMIPVNDHFQTATESIYAIGDVIRGPMLAHKAEDEGVAIAEQLAGQKSHVNYETVPSVVYTWPELASVGLTEEQCAADGRKVKIGTFPFMPNGRARAMGSTDGLAKVIADAKTDRLLGVHIVGPRASEMIAEAVVAMEMGASSEDLARSFHAHPTMSEVLREAALNVDQRARQM